MPEDSVTLPGPPDASVVIRAITPADDAAIESIIRTVLGSFGCTGPGLPDVDAELPAMSAAYRGGDERYFVVEVDGTVLGGGGFGRLAGTTADQATCELRKMYFLPELRGRGVGRRLLTYLLEQMRAAGYDQAYLETTTQMEAARRLYRRFGFEELAGPIGDTGHRLCDRRFLKGLRDA